MKAKQAELIDPKHEAAAIRAMHEDCLGLVNRSLETVRKIGDRLNVVKASKIIPHGEWESFVERQCGFSAGNARRYMLVAKNWPILEARESSKRASVRVLTLTDACKHIADATKPDDGEKPRRQPSGGADRSDSPIADTPAPVAPVADAGDADAGDTDDVSFDPAAFEDDAPADEPPSPDLKVEVTPDAPIGPDGLAWNDSLSEAAEELAGWRTPDPRRAAKPFDLALRELKEWEDRTVANLILSDEPGSAFVRTCESDFRVRVNNLRDLLKTRRPHSLCPECGGERCRTCLRSGLVPARLAKNAKGVA